MIRGENTPRIMAQVDRAFSRTEPVGSRNPGKKERKKDYFIRGGGMIGLDFTYCFAAGFLGFIPLLKLDFRSYSQFYFTDFIMPSHRLLQFQVDSFMVLACFFLFSSYYLTAYFFPLIRLFWWYQVYSYNTSVPAFEDLEK